MVWNFTGESVYVCISPCVGVCVTDCSTVCVCVSVLETQLYFFMVTSRRRRANITVYWFLFLLNVVIACHAVIHSTLQGLVLSAPFNVFPRHYSHLRDLIQLLLVSELNITAPRYTQYIFRRVFFSFSLKND